MLDASLSEIVIIYLPHWKSYQDYWEKITPAISNKIM